MFLALLFLIGSTQCGKILNTDYEGSSEWFDDGPIVMDMIVYDDYAYDDYAYEPSWLKNTCSPEEYQIEVTMGSDLWSGTDDRVEIRIYSFDSATKWFDLEKKYQPIDKKVDILERLSIDTFCVEPDEEFASNPDNFPVAIGLRKFGSDDMKIEKLVITRFGLTSIFYVQQWIKNSDELLVDVYTYYK